MKIKRLFIKIHLDEWYIIPESSGMYYRYYTFLFFTVNVDLIDKNLEQ